MKFSNVPTFSAFLVYCLLSCGLMFAQVSLEAYPEFSTSDYSFAQDQDSPKTSRIHKPLSRKLVKKVQLSPMNQGHQKLSSSALANRRTMKWEMQQLNTGFYQINIKQASVNKPALAPEKILLQH